MEEELDDLYDNNTIQEFIEKFDNKQTSEKDLKIQKLHS